MKVRACVFLKETNEYMKDSLGKLVHVHAEDAANLKKNYPHEHNRREYRNTRANPERRQRLMLVTRNNTSFFSYIGEQSRTVREAVDESESHHAAIEALSRLTTMNFHSVDSELPLEPFHFSEIKVEPKLELANGNVYFPDLLCTFREDHPLYDRWGGKLAIEVTYAHPCEEAKIHDFMFHNIPILELVIDKGSSREYPGERYKWEYYSLASIEKHTNDLEIWFRDFIGVNILVDPISNRAHEQITTELSREIEELGIQNASVYEELLQYQQKQSKLCNDISKLESKYSRMVQEHNEDKKEERRKSNVKAEQLLEQNRAEKSKSVELEDKLKQKSLLASSLLTYSLLLTTLVAASLIAPYFFMETSIEAIKWYLRQLS